MVRKRSVLEILDAAFFALRRRFVPLLAIGVTYGAAGPIFVELILPAEDELGLIDAIHLVSQSILGFFASVATAQLLLSETQGKSSELSHAMWCPIQRFKTVVSAALLATFAVTAGLMLLFIPGFFLLTTLLLAPQVLVLEGTGAAQALQRSWTLTRGNRLRVAFILMAYILPLVVMTIFLPEDWPPYVLTLVELPFAIFADVACFYLYLDLRCRKEDYDLTFLAEQVGASRTSA